VKLWYPIQHQQNHQNGSDMADAPLTTRQKLLLIIEGMEQADSIITISGVAREAGISSSAIHNRYSDLADRIRASAGVMKGQDAKGKLGKQRGTIMEEKAKRARLRQELAQVKALLQKADSVNASLQLENGRLKALNRKYLEESNRLKGDIAKI
jgi:AcrR family transcriptional regulator